MTLKKCQMLVVFTHAKVWSSLVKFVAVLHMAFWNFQSCVGCYTSSAALTCGIVGLYLGSPLAIFQTSLEAVENGMSSTSSRTSISCGRKWFSRKRPFFPPSWTDWKLFDHDEEDAAAIQIHGILGAAWNDDLVWNYSINLFWPLNMPLGQWILLRGWWNPKPPPMKLIYLICLSSLIL